MVLSSDKLQGELEEKQAVSSEKQCGIELGSADRPNPPAAGMSCAPRCMNGVDCVKFCEISSPILIMYFEIHRFTSTSSHCYSSCGTLRLCLG